MSLLVLIYFIFFCIVYQQKIKFNKFTNKLAGKVIILVSLQLDVNNPW